MSSRVALQHLNSGRYKIVHVEEAARLHAAAVEGKAEGGACTKLLEGLCG
jgi:hypothetical protein